MEKIIKETYGGTGYQLARPNLFLLGVAKCATTFIASTLGRHPEILLANNKEPRFFSKDIYQEGLEWYLKKHFRGYDGEKYVMDANTDHIFVPYVAERIKQSCIDPKFIVSIREPIGRAFRQYEMYKRYRPGYCRDTFEEELQLNMEYFSYDRFKYEREFMADTDYKGGCYNPSFIEQGLYWTHINRYLKMFGNNSVIVLQSEELRRDKWYDFVLTILDIDIDSYQPEFKPKNVVREPYSESCDLHSLCKNHPTAMMVAKDIYYSEIALLSGKIGEDLITKWGYDKL